MERINSASVKYLNEEFDKKLKQESSEKIEKQKYGFCRFFNNYLNFKKHTFCLLCQG